MKTLGIITAVVVVGMAFAGTPSTAHATQICDDQYQQCLDAGIYPVYKCEQLRELCEDTYGFQSTAPVLFDRSKLTWMRDATSLAQR